MILLLNGICRTLVLASKSFGLKEILLWNFAECRLFHEHIKAQRIFFLLQANVDNTQLIALMKTHCRNTVIMRAICCNLFISVSYVGA